MPLQALAVDQHNDRDGIETNDRLKCAQEGTKYMQMSFQHRQMRLWASPKRIAGHALDFSFKVAGTYQQADIFKDLAGLRSQILYFNWEVQCLQPYFSLSASSLGYQGECSCLMLHLLHKALGENVVRIFNICASVWNVLISLISSLPMIALNHVDSK